MTTAGEPMPDIGTAYSIEREVGRGGMATVYAAHDRRHQRRVAVKVLNRDVAAALGTTRFLHEITTAAGLSHPNIVPVHDSGEHDGRVYYVMPHIEGETLRELLTREKRLPLAEVVRITTRVAAALDFAHRHGVVHRDIKPENIILFEGEPLVLDFGIAKALTAAGGESLTRTGVAVGTPAYLSPEQASGETNLGAPSDQYSLACTVYEMVAGVPPFTAASPQGVIAKRFTEKPRSLSQVVNGVPQDFSDAVSRALSLESHDRFASVTEFAQALARATPSAEQSMGESDKPSVAVLPFTNMSTDAENEFFADGITEEIINALTKVRALDVPSRTASFAFKGTAMDVDEISRKLKVRNILEGSVRKAGNRLRVTVQLVDVATGNTLWSERFDRELADIFEIQDEIAKSIVEALKIVLTGEEEETVTRKPPTQSVRAYEYYLRGRQLFHQRRPETLDAAEDMYRRAIALDPNYALAYAGLADCSTFRAAYHGGGEEALAQAEAASKRALELDPNSAEAHAARGLTLSHQHRLQEAQREFEQALQLDPTLYEAAYYYGRALQAAGEPELAVRMYERAVELRPDDYQSLAFAATAYQGMQDQAGATAASRRMVAAAEQALSINPGDARALYLGAINLERIGESKRAQEWAQRALQIDASHPVMLYNIACFHANAGRVDLALDHLERATELGFHHTDWLETDPDLSNVRTHPRFRELLEKVGRL